jgi:small subunit ribosomal protein S7e
MLQMLQLHTHHSTPITHAREGGPRPRPCVVARHLPVPRVRASRTDACAHAWSRSLSPAQLEKKFSGKHVVLIGQRRIMRKPSAGQRQPKQKRPRSRTLTAVHESILEDLVYPTEIVGKHTRYRLDGSKICKVYLDPKEAPNVEYKVDTFATVYKKLTGKEVKFEFPTQESH